MGPMNDEDEMVTRAVGEVPVRSESQTDAGTVAEPGDDQAGVDERLVPAIEEAGYGYGV
jgi:hypothetical protein